MKKLANTLVRMYGHRDRPFWVATTVAIFIFLATVFIVAGPIHFLIALAMKLGAYVFYRTVVSRRLEDSFAEETGLQKPNRNGMGMLVSVCVFLSIATASYVSMKMAIDAAKERKYMYDSIISIYMPLKLTAEADDSARIFVLHGRQSDKANFLDAERRISHTLKFLDHRAADHTGLSRYRSAVNDHLVDLHKIVDARSAGIEVALRTAESVLPSGTMRQIGIEADRVRAMMERKVNELTARAQLAADAVMIFIPLASVIGVVVAVSSMSWMSRLQELRDRLWSDKEAAWAAQAESWKEKERAELLFSTVIDLAPNAVIVSDQTGLIRVWNNAAESIFGYTAEQAVGQPLTMLMPERYRIEHAAGFATAVTTGNMPLARHPMELSGLRASGEEFPLEVTLDGAAVDGQMMFFAVLRDTTQVRRLERDLRRSNLELKASVAELARSNTELGQFASVAGHDLQSPLRQIVSYVQLLKRRHEGQLGSDADDFIKYIVDGATRMQALITDLLEFARVGHSAVAVLPVSIDEVIATATKNLCGACPDAKIEWESLPVVLGDRGLLIQIFQNLISNAVKFSKDDKWVRIWSYPRGTGWEIAVSDSGIGIAPEHVEQIFIMFKRLHGTEYPGTGIGLAICKKAVERLGGSIRVESAVGQGSTFFVYLNAPATHVNTHSR